MTRTVNVEMLRAEIEKRGHLGREKLSLETGMVTVSSINRMLSNHKAPNIYCRAKLAEVLGTTVDELFPLVGRKKTA